MKVLHITPETNGYEIVELVANRVNKTNQMAVIIKNGETFITGGITITDSDKIKNILDGIPKSEQYELVKEFKITPFVKMYFEE